MMRRGRIVIDSETKRQALELLKAAPIIQLFAFLDILAERASLDADQLRIDTVQICDRLQAEERNKPAKR